MPPRWRMRMPNPVGETGSQQEALHSKDKVMLHGGRGADCDLGSWTASAMGQSETVHALS